MEMATMGRVTTEALIENLGDLLNAEAGKLSVDKVRRLKVDDALVDTGATFLSLPSRLIKQLGLAKMQSRKIISSIGPSEAGVYSPVRLTIMGRFCSVEVMEVPDSVPVLVGQI